MGKSSFDLSLLKPVDEKNSDFQSHLKPVDEQEEDTGAYLDKLSSQPQESFLSKLPRNILIGLAHAGRDLHNLPHDAVHLIEGQNGPFKRPLSSYLPNDETDYSSAFGGNEASDTLMDKLIKGGVEYAVPISESVKALKAGKGLLKGTTYLSKVEKAAQESGHAFNFSPSLVEEARSYLPRSQATNEMIRASEAGNYPASFGLQSEIGMHQRDYAKSLLKSDKLLAPRLGDLKQSMLGELGTLLHSHGMTEEAELLKKGINNYRQYMQVKNAVMPIIKKAGIPTSIAAALGFGWGKAKNILRD